MSFLNSVIGSIGNKDAVPSPPLSSLPCSEPVPTSQKPSVQRNGPSSKAQAAPSDNKRKAEDALPRPNDKAFKGNGYRGTSSLVSPYATSQQSAQAKKAPNAPPASSTPSLPHRAAKTTPASAPPAPALATSTPADGVKAPKKGSFAEIMARAKTAQEAPPAIGTIKHLAKDKNAISDSKLLRNRKRALAAQKAIRGPKGHTRSSSGSLSSGSMSRPVGKPGEPERKKAPEIAYRGTAKPKPQPSYKGTMKPVTSTSSFPTKKPTSRAEGPRSRYANYSDNTEGEDTEGGNSYSNESEDMEAGFSDVEQEEVKATKLARKEDEEEARKEAEHQARKQKLKELAKKAKPRKY